MRRHLDVCLGALLSFGVCLFVSLPNHGAFGAPLSSPPSGKSNASARRSEPDAFRIQSFAPRGVAATEDTVSVVFSSDAISTETLATTSTAQQPLIYFSPSLTGVFAWESQRKLRFTPRDGLRPCTRYTARVTPGLTSLAGQKLSGPTEFTFNTPALALRQVEQVGFTPDRRALVELTFTGEIVPTDLYKFLSMNNGGAPLGWHLESDVKTAAPRVVTDPIATETLSLRLEPGLRCVAGPLGLQSAVDRIIPLKFRLVTEQLTARWMQDKAALVLKFSNPVQVDELRNYIQVEPQTAFEVTDEGERVVLTGEFQPTTRYSVTVKQGLQGTNGELLLSDTTLSTWVPPMRAFLEMKDAGGHLSSAGTMRLRVQSAGLSSFTVRASRVFDNNLVYYAAGNEGEWGVRRLGTEVASKEIAVQGEPGKPVLTLVDLRELLGKNPGGIYSIEVRAERPKDAWHGEGEDNGGYYRNGRYISNYGDLQDQALINISNLGIVGKRSARQLAVWVASLDTAKPVAGAQVRAYTAKNQMVGQAQTDANGMAILSDLPQDKDSRPVIVTASHAEDTCFLNLRRSLAGEEQMQTQGRDYLVKGYEAFVATERGAYRPGETVHLFGYLRGRGVSAPESFPLTLRVETPDHKRWEPRTVTLDSSASLNLDLQVPSYAPTGLYRAYLELPGKDKKASKDQADSEESGDEEGSERGRDDDASKHAPSELGSVTFLVEDFMPNRLKVEATAPEKRFSTSEPLTLAVQAQEMFGQPAAGRTVDSVVNWRPEPFAPPQFKQYSFGDPDVVFTPIEKELEPQTLDEAGKTTFTIEPPEAKAPAALQAHIQVTVKDVGGRGVSASVERTVDPVPFYIGVRQNKEGYARPGVATSFEVVAVRPDATLVTDSLPLTATVYRVRYNSILKREDGSFRYETNRELSALQTSTLSVTDGSTSVSWTPPQSGQYLIKVADPSMRTVTALQFYVTSYEWGEQPWSLEKPERLELVLDKKRYAPGETARLLVKAPFPGTLLLTLEQDKVLSSSVIEMAKNTQEVALPITQELMPNFYVVASVIRPVRPAEKWMPHRAFGLANVELTHDSRRLDIAFAAPQEVRPQSEFEVGISVKDALTSQGEPCQMNVWAVDEGILTLTDFKTPDPVEFFYAPRRLMVAMADFFSELMPDLLTPAKAKSAPGGDGMSEKKRQSPVTAERVRPVSLWLGTLTTDAQGSATAHFRVPQFMGRLRVMAVAAAQEQFGNASGNVFVRSPLMVKENLPRFLAPGDEAKVPFVLYNNTDTAAAATIDLSTSLPLLMPGSKTALLQGASFDQLLQTSASTGQIPARGMASQPVVISALDRAGVGRVAFRAAMDGHSFGDTIELPVRPASPFVRLTGNEVVDGGQSKTLSLPGADFLQGTSSGTLVISPQPAVQFAGGLRYVAHYPYGCVEQTASSVFPLLYFGELAAQIEPGRYSGDALHAMVQSGIERLLSMQTSSGGLAMWPGEREPWGWGSAYGAHFLVEARKAGYAVPEEYLGALLDYLRQRLAFRPDQYVSEQQCLTERCYTCYILALADKRAADRMEELYEKRKQLSQTGRALLACAYMVGGNRAQASELLHMSPGAPSETRETGGILSSPIRETAILLGAYLDTTPQAPEVAQLAQRLMSSSRDGYWYTTQDTAFALWALGRYVKQTSSRLDNYQGTVRLASGQTRDFSSSAPLELSSGIAGEQATVEVRGTGRAYVYYTVEGVPMRPDAKPVSRGIEISRRYTDRAGKALDPQQLEQGKLVVVEIEIKADRHLDNVVVEDLLPAGLEIENANLASAEHLEDEGESEKPKAGLQVERTEARDDRMTAFMNLSGNAASGKYVFRYAVRAVTEGTFAQPAVQASCMYDPNIEARSTGGGTVRVVGRGR